MAAAPHSRSPGAEARALAWFIAALLAISWLLEVAITRDGGVGGPTFERFAPLVMFVPGIAALVWLRLRGVSLRFVDWRPGRPLALALAVVLPAASALAIVAVATALGVARSPHLEWTGAEVVVQRGAFVLGRGAQSPPWFALNLLVSAAALSLVNGFVAAGEEIGWRGVMQKQLIGLGTGLRGIVLLGLVWAHWHTPIILQGYNYPETPLLGALLLWPLTCVTVSIVLAWLTRMGRSVWPAALAHGGWNAFHGGLVDGMTPAGARLPLDLIALAAWAAMAFAVLPALRRDLGRERDAARAPALTS